MLYFYGACLFAAFIVYNWDSTREMILQLWIDHCFHTGASVGTIENGVRWIMRNL